MVGADALGPYFGGFGGWDGAGGGGGSEGEEEASSSGREGVLLLSGAMEGAVAAMVSFMPEVVSSDVVVSLDMAEGDMVENEDCQYRAVAATAQVCDGRYI